MCLNHDDRCMAKLHVYPKFQVDCLNSYSYHDDYVVLTKCGPM